MDELVIAKINADMGEAAFQRVVEHQVARPQVLVLDLFADPADFFRGARQRLAPRLQEYITHKAAAIETGIGGIAAEFVMNAQHADRLQGEFGGAAGEIVKAGQW